MMRSAFSGVTFLYQVPSGYTTQIGPAGTDAQALALRPVERTVRAGQVQLLQALLQVAPGPVPLVGVDAVGTDADEQVPRQLSHAECFCDGARELILPFAHMKIPAPRARIAARLRRVLAGIGRDSRVFPPPPPRTPPGADVSDYNALAVAPALLDPTAVETSQSQRSKGDLMANDPNRTDEQVLRSGE